MAIRRKNYWAGILGILILVGVVGCRAASDFSIEIESSSDTFSFVGETITYTYIVRDMGEGVSKITFSDAMVGLACPETSLNEYNYTNRWNPCTGEYQVTEEDFAAGFITNKASARGYQRTYCGDFGAGWVTTTDEHTITFMEAPDLKISLNGTPNWFTGPDQTIEYTYLIENMGNVNLAGPVQVEDDLQEVSCPEEDLTPGEKITCEVEYRTTPADVEAEQVSNTASAIMDGITSNSASFTAFLEGTPELTLSKSTEWTIFSYLGQSVKYIFELKNTGNVVIQAPFEPDDPGLLNWTCPDQALQPGETIICTGEYTILDQDFGSDLENCATVMGVYKGGQVVSNESCALLFYVPPMDPPEDSICDQDPNSWDCFCEKNPNDKDC